MEDAESLAQSVAERLSEDEALRGDLTDEGFGPLLNWATEAAIAYASNLKSDKPEEAMDTYGSRLKGVMQEVVAAADAGKIDNPAPLLDFEMAQPDAARQKLANLKLEASSPDANAIEITKILSEALSAAPAPAQTPPSAEAASASAKAEEAASQSSEAKAETPKTETSKSDGATAATKTVKINEDALESVSPSEVKPKSNSAALNSTIGSIVGNMFKQASSKARITMSKGIQRAKKLKRPSFSDKNQKKAK